MKASSALTFKKINSSKQLTRELATATKEFQGKESEYNWEKRERTLLWLKSLLHDPLFDHWKDIIIRGVHDLVFGIADAIRSLRTKYAMVAFDLIIDIAHVIGTKIDATTFETLFTSLLKCGNSSKQMIATKANHTTISFLSNTSYHNKAITLLCSAFNDDKNPQSRDFTATYLKTCLQTHAPKTMVRENMERLNTVNTIECFLKAGLLDATPSVRQSCRSTFWIYHKYWPQNGDRLLKTLDLVTRKQLEKSKLPESNVKRQGVLGKRPISPTMAANDHSRHRVKSALKSTSSIPLLKRKTSSNSSSMFEEAPSTSKHSPSPPPLASASLLHLLRSHDISNNCNGLRILSKRLTTNLNKSSNNNSYEMVLPPTVPSRADLMPVILNYLSPDQMLKNELLCDQLMSWDCLAGVFVRIFSLHHFLPTLILGSGHRNCGDGNHVGESCQQQKCHSLCALGLKRLKLYLKYNDPDLFQSLLDILLTTTVPGAPGLRDPNAKNELRKNSSTLNGSLGDKARDDLVAELIRWLDEIVCSYVGLEEDDDDNGNGDTDVVIEWQQQPWAKDTTASDTYVCTQWLGDNDRLASCLTSILSLFKSYSTSTAHSAVLACLLSLVGKLRLVSTRIFDLVVARAADKDLIRLLDACLGRHPGMNSLSQNNMDTNTCNDDVGETLVDENYYDGDIDDPPPAYDDIFDPSPLIVHDDDDDDDSQQQHEPSFILTTLNQQDSHDDLSDGEGDNDVLDTSLGSINLEIISPEPSLASTQDPSELDDFILESTSINEDLVSETSPLEYHNDNQPDDDRISLGNDITPSVNSTTTLNDECIATDLLTKTVERLLNSTTLDNNHSILGTLEHLCKEYVVKNETDYRKNGKVWIGRLLRHGGGSSLLRTLVEQLADDLIKLSQQLHQRNPSYRDGKQQVTVILRLIKQILVQQCFLFQRSDIEKETETVALAITRALIYTKHENYGQVPTMVDEIYDILLGTISIRSCITITAHLLKQQYDIDMKERKDESSPSSTAAFMTRAYPMSTLFNMVVKLAKKLKPELMDEFLTKKGCSDCFIQGINHSVLSIRQSCVNALVALSYDSGTYQDIKHYLPNLRKEQQTLLDYYINQRQ